MDLGEQAADPVRGCSGLLGQIVVKTRQHGKFARLFVGKDDEAQQVRQGAGGLGNDVRILASVLASLGCRFWPR